MTRRQLLWRAVALGMAPSAAAVLAACGSTSGGPPAPAKPAEPKAETKPAEPKAAEPKAEVKPAESKPAAPAAASPAAAPSPAASPAAQAAPAKASGPLATLTVAIVSNIQNIAEPIGAEKGFFLKYGIDLKIATLNSGVEALKAIQSNEAQFGNTGVGALATARSQGIKARAIALLCSSPTELLPDHQVAIVATASSGITSVQDLVGKRIATTPGVAPDFYLKAVLAKAGIPENKVELLNVQPPNILAALQSGVHAGTASEPYPELFLAKLPGSRLVVRNGGYVAQRPIVAVMEDWLAANRPLAEGFAAGLAEATQFMRQRPDESAEISARWLSGVEVPILRKALGHLSLDTRMSPVVRQGWETEVKVLVDRGSLKQMIAFDESVEVALLESVSQKNPAFFSDLKPLS